MQIRRLKIRNFRGIAALDWTPADAFCCLIGAGDSGKSTILDAIEATLSSKWYTFTEPDFLGCVANKSIELEVTVGELSKALMSDERTGLYIRGWTALGVLNEEPEDGDEPVLTVRLTVDATMEPVWELVCDRVEEPRTLSNRDRAQFGLVRLSGDDARHLAWGQNSVLSRITGSTEEAAAKLADAYRAARASAKLDEIEALSTAAERAQEYAQGLGAYVEGQYAPGLELGRSGLSSGSIALHDDGVPLRLAGTGTRRLATLAIQKAALTDGGIVIVDEIEHGLEPHRVIGAIAQLKSEQNLARLEQRPIGQLIMTTHSDVALHEVGSKALRIVKTERPSKIASVIKIAAPQPINSLMRYMPRALFANRILVTEGNTEVGMMLGLREDWPARHRNVPIEQTGAAIVDGNGDEAPSMAIALSIMGYRVALYRDSDVALNALTVSSLAAAGIPTFEYGENLRTEQALFLAASDAEVQQLVQYARLERGNDSVDDSIRVQIPDLAPGVIRTDFSNWDLNTSLAPEQIRNALAEVAHRKRWFKDQRIGRGLAPIVSCIIASDATCPIARTLSGIEAWIYA